MSMKKTGLFIFLAAFCGIVAYWQLSPKEEAVKSDVSTYEVSPGTAKPIDQNISTEVVQPQKNVEESKAWEVDEQKLQEGQKQLAELIEEYNMNLDEPEKRAELEARLAELSAAYKKEVLAKVKNSLQNQ